MPKQLAAKYNPQDVEQKIYNYWSDNQYFKSTPNQQQAYTVLIPPPNVTGVLHMGHMLNNTLQDVLVRRARMLGYNACWVPGTDHASIATEAKVVNKLKEQGIDKQQIGREKFLEHAWDWTNEHGGIILEQLKKIGASCDWDRTKFTLDDDLYQSVITVFVDLYNKGLIYRDYKMVNWDPEAKTTISDEEVVYEETNGKLYHIKYKIANTDDFVCVATTRPETIFGDTAICVNPNDARYQHLIGKQAIVPIVNRQIPIIADDYVDTEFGTGCLKITPAHDINDYNIGQKHQLEIIDIFTDDAKLNQNGQHYQGKDRFVVRKEIEQELTNNNLLIKAENYTNKVGKSERTKAAIEPKLSVQWFLSMQDIAQRALQVVLDGKVQFHPNHYINTYKHWLENIRDWNISRQLWWGHRIPAYFYADGLEDFVVAQTAQEALRLAQQKTNNPNLTINDLKQDEDVLDTWFSSWLWPISVFNGINQPNNPEIHYYYPTSDLVTGPDIIFFWVARMIMAGNEFMNQVPFKNVYFTGLVRDKERRKMSKSLGNSPDPIQLINHYGADGVRVGLLLSSSAGNDLMFDEDLCLQGRNFANKIWNAYRLINGWETADTQPTENAQQAVLWLEEKLKEQIQAMNNDFDKFRISDALMKLYKLIWDDFCSTYLEAIKPAFGQPIDKATHQQSIQFFQDLLKLLHPFMPFLTEELWQQIKDRKSTEALMISPMPKYDTKYNQDILNDFDSAMSLVANIRNLRKEKQIPHKEHLEIQTKNQLPEFTPIVQQLTNCILTQTNQISDKASSFRSGTTEFFVELNNLIDTGAEKQKLQEELKYLQGFLQSVEKKLSNQQFVSNAPEKVVAMEQKKQSDAKEKMDIIKEALAKL